MWRLSPHIKTAIVTKPSQLTTKLARTIATNCQPFSWKAQISSKHQSVNVHKLQLFFPLIAHNNAILFARRFSTIPTENTQNKNQPEPQTNTQQSSDQSGEAKSGQPLGNIFQNQNQDGNNNNNTYQEHRTIITTTGPLEVALKVSNWDHVRNILSAVLWLVIIYYIFFSKETPFSNFTASPAKESVSEKTRLSDVKGNEEAKEELEDVILYLKETQRFQNMGVKPPKGLLFIGPPGCGKTLLAKALAGEAGVAFYYTSGAEFEEMFVGVGAGRVRKLFQKARNGQGAIIFIDEIDAIGSRFDRDASGKAGKQTLNQLLVEMDGFKPNDKIVVIAATNAPQVLDPALVRPGRFDRTVSVSLPQLEARKEIIELYLQGRGAPDVDVDRLARSTTGYSGADLFSMVNGAGIRAVKAKLPFIPMALLEQAKEDVALGPERKSSPLSEEMKRLTAFHESGHALVALHGSKDHEIDKATLIPRSKAAGYVRFNKDENTFASKEYLRNEIAIAMGGRAAEELVFGPERITPGASNDFEQATTIAERMVTEFGMSDKVGHQSFAKNKYKRASEQTKVMLDTEIKSILEEEYKRAKAILVNNRKQLNLLAESLIQYEELSLDEIKIIINGGSITELRQKQEEDRKKAQAENVLAFEKVQAEKLAQLQQAAAEFAARNNKQQDNNKQQKDNNKDGKDKQTSNFVRDVFAKVLGLEW